MSLYYIVEVSFPLEDISGGKENEILDLFDYLENDYGERDAFKYTIGWGFTCPHLARGRLTRVHQILVANQGALPVGTSISLKVKVER